MLDGSEALDVAKHSLGQHAEPLQVVHVVLGREAAENMGAGAAATRASEVGQQCPVDMRVPGVEKRLPPVYRYWRPSVELCSHTP